MNYSMGAPEPTIGEAIWMRCPYPADLCGADATMLVSHVSDAAVEGLVTCAVGHRWKVARLADDQPDGEDTMPDGRAWMDEGEQDT